MASSATQASSQAGGEVAVRLQSSHTGGGAAGREALTAVGRGESGGPHSVPGKPASKGETTMRSEVKEMNVSKQETPHVIGVHHVGLSARDPAALAAFYHDVLGLQVVGGSTADASAFGATAFLRSQPEEHHDLALVANPAFQ